MRIIKLSKDKFSALRDVQDFFREDLPQFNPPGKFRITKRRIASDALDVDEQLVFTYKARPVYTATVESGIEPSDDEYSSEFPVCFRVKLSTLKEVEDSPVTRDSLRDLPKGPAWIRLWDPEAAQVWTALR